MNYWMRFSHDLKNNTDRGGCGCYRPRRIRSYESLVWDQALHRGKKEKKIGVGEKKEPRGSLGRGKSVFLCDPVFAFFPHRGGWSQANESLIPIFVNYSMCCTLL